MYIRVYRPPHALLQSPCTHSRTRTRTHTMKSRWSSNEYELRSANQHKRQKCLQTYTAFMDSITDPITRVEMYCKTKLSRAIKGNLRTRHCIHWRSWRLECILWLFNALDSIMASARTVRSYGFKCKVSLRCLSIHKTNQRRCLGIGSSSSHCHSATPGIHFRFVRQPKR